ncbi:MAG: hypothetical protein MK196_12570, partial [Acidimicrobiales bacterium]|nr:hypothetical protein [Acidimicrobiales bacterium]
MPNVEVGRDLRVFVSGQEDYQNLNNDASGGGGEGFPQDSDAFRVITASANGSQTWEDREDKFGTAAPILGAPQKASGEASLEAYITASGSRGAWPAWNTLIMKSGFTAYGGAGDPSDANTTSTGSSSGKTQVQVQTGAATNFMEGASVLIEQHDGSGNGFGSFDVRWITDINTGTDVIQFSPPLSQSCAHSGLMVKGGNAYVVDDDRAEQSMAMYVMNGSSMDRVAGWTPTTVSISMGGDTASRITFSGTAREHVRMMPTQLTTGGGVNDTADVWDIGNVFVNGGGEMFGLDTYWS